MKELWAHTSAGMSAQVSLGSPSCWPHLDRTPPVPFHRPRSRRRLHPARPRPPPPPHGPCPWSGHPRRPAATGDRSAGPRFDSPGGAVQGDSPIPPSSPERVAAASQTARIGSYARTARRQRLVAGARVVYRRGPQGVSRPAGEGLQAIPRVGPQLRLFLVVAHCVVAHQAARAVCQSSGVT